MNLRQLLEEFDRFTLASEHPRVLLFGDSALHAVETLDGDDLTFAQAVLNGFPSAWRTSVLGFYAANVAVYNKLWSCIESRPYPPEVVIVPFSLRAFSPLWFLNPRHSYSCLLKSLDSIKLGANCEQWKSIDFDEEIGLDPLASLSAVPDLKWRFSGLGDTDIREFFDVLYKKKQPDHMESRRFLLTGYYLFQLSEDHGLWALWRDLIRRILDRGCFVIAYVCGFNYLKVKSVVGDDLDESIRAKLKLSRKFFEEFSTNERFHHVDFTSSLGADCYFDYVEHLSLKGRRIMAILLYRMAEILLTQQATPRT